MERGKKKCEILSNIRREIAERQGLQYEPRDCHHEGDCSGTCPACDAELKDLQKQLEDKGINEIAPSSVQIESNGEDYSREPELPAGIPAPPDYREGMVLSPDPDDLIQLQGEVMPPEHFFGAEDERIFLETYVAGVKFHDALDVWSELDEGMPVTLVRDTENRHDDNAVAVVYASDNEDGVRQEYTLGYIPKEVNAQIAAMLDMGWPEMLRCEITDMQERKQGLSIDITIYLKNKSAIEVITKEKCLRYLVLDPDCLKEFTEQMAQNGTCHFRWGGYPPWNQDLPKEGEKVLFLNYNNEDTIELCLMLVIGVHQSALPFLEDEKELFMKDDCVPYALSCIARNVIVNTDEFFEEYNVNMDYWMPEKRFTEDQTDKILKMFNLDE